MRESVAPLQNRSFRPLVGAFLVNELGDWFGAVALAIVVFDHTGSAAATAGLFLATQFLPAFLAPPLVARLELLRRGPALPWVYGAEGLAFGLLALSLPVFSLPVVFALAAADGVFSSVARALSRATAAAILAPSGNLREGNALLNLSFTGGAAVGPALAGLVVSGLGARSALAAAAVAFVAVALLVARVPALRQASSEPAAWRVRLREGIAYVRGRAILARLIGLQAAAIAFFTLVVPIEVVFVKETLDAGDAGYGAFLGAWGIGMLVGGVLFSALRSIPLAVLLAASTGAIGVAYLATAFAPGLAVACAALALSGVGNGIQWVALVSAVQELIDEDFQARVISVLESAASAAPGIGFLAGGAIASIFDPRAAFAVAGAGVIVVLAISCVSLRGLVLPARQREGQETAEPFPEPLHSPP